MSLTRDSIRSGYVSEMIKKAGLSDECQTEDQLRSSVSFMLDNQPTKGPVWIFGYGSLLWNPAFNFVERRYCSLQGYHRSFCLKSFIGRGTPETPGLMLALKSGGSCEGIALQVDPDNLEEELFILWSREMPMKSYTPGWVELRTSEGELFHGVAFLSNPEHPRYLDSVSEEESLHLLATGHGHLGTASEYLYNTVSHLADLDIHDPSMSELADKVRQHQAKSST
jgi:glutathione-specific gamma-glutamylcyclotransferase